MQQVLTQMGVPLKGAALYIEMFKAINAGVLVPFRRSSVRRKTPPLHRLNNLCRMSLRGKLQPLRTDVNHRA